MITLNLGGHDAEERSIVKYRQHVSMITQKSVQYSWLYFCWITIIPTIPTCAFPYPLCGYVWHHKITDMAKILIQP